MVKDHSDSDRGNPLPPLNGLLFLISSKGLWSTGWNKKQHVGPMLAPCRRGATGPSVVDGVC